MTDNEIIKALECCFVEESCSKCPWYIDCKSNVLESIPYGLGRAAFDLINRQKKENSNLNSRLTSLQNDLTSAKAEIKSLRRENKILSKNAAEAFQEGLNENRNLFTEEILKEFAHFLIDRAEGGVIRICDLPDLVIDFQTEENEK